MIRSQNQPVAGPSTYSTISHSVPSSARAPPTPISPDDMTRTQLDSTPRNHATSASQSSISLNSYPVPMRDAPPPPVSSQPLHVQAIHDFHYSLLASTASSDPGTYLAFQAGDVIRVHTRDASGWWDGEISGSSSEVTIGPGGEPGPRRGWFPSNYVREMGWNAPHQRSSSVASTTSPSSTHPDAASAHSRQDSSVSHRSRASTSTSVSHSHSRGQSHSHYQSPGHGHSRPTPTPLSGPIQALLHPIVQSLSLLESAIHSNRKPHIQPSTACVISAIRSALSQTDCLSKESTTLVTWPILARERKIVLVELSRLVNCARSASGVTDAPETDSQPDPEEIKELEALARAARGVFSSVKRFLHLANDCGVTVTSVETSSGEGELPTPTSAPPSAFDNNAIRKLKTRNPTSSNTRMQEAFRMKAASIGDLRAARRRASSPPPPLPTAASSVARSPSISETPMSATFASSSGSGRSSPVSTKSVTHRQRGGLEGSSFSSVASGSSDPPNEIEEPNAATPTMQPSESVDKRQYDSVAHVSHAISVAEDALLSVIAAFIGHIHSHSINSHPSSHAYLIELTKETIDSVRELLTIVEAVGRHPGVRAAYPREIETLRVAKDSLYDVASRLVEGSEAVANAPFEELGEEGYDVEKARLLQAATGTLRSGTECVRLVKGLPDGELGLQAPEGSQSIEARRDSYLGARGDHNPPGPRDKVVGARGVHTLSGLHRKATSLSHLQKKYLDDGLVAPNEGDEESQEDDDDDQEVVKDLSFEEDVTLRPVDGSLRSIGGSPRPPLRQAFTSPGDIPRLSQVFPINRESQSDRRVVTATRSRSSSLTSPAPPPRMKHRSPSRSADLDKFTGDYPPTDQFRPESQYPSSSGSSTRASQSSQVSLVTVETSGLSSTTSFHQTPVAQPYIREADAENSPILGYLKTEVPSMGSFPKLATLSIDTDNQVDGFKSFPLRPAQPVRSVTAPLPGSNSDVRSWVVAHDYDPREITLNSDGVMNGASLQVIVEKMTPHDTTVDPMFWSTFFLTFRLFTTPSKLLEAVVRRYDLQPPASLVLGQREKALWIERKVVPVRLRIYNFLKTWLEVHWRSESDNIILPNLMAFAEDIMSTTLPAMSPRLIEAVKRRQDPSISSNGSDSSSMQRSSTGDRLRNNTAALMSSPFSPITLTNNLPPTPIINGKLHNNLRNKVQSINITDFDALELARQFTLMESKLFMAIVPEDLLMTGKKSIRELKALSTLSNQVTGWVADGILNEMDPKRRAGLLKFYIKLADKCLSLNNFSTLFAVLAGLNSSTILRLKKTWDALSSKYRVIMDRLRGVIEHTKNHAAYRGRLREATGPCLPFLGLILTDITFTSDGNPNTRPSTLDPELQLINQDKYNKLAKIAMDFQRFQQPFVFVEIPEVQEFLQRVLTERGSGSLDALYRKSLLLEPRQVSEKLSSAVEKPGWLGGKI